MNNVLFDKNADIIFFILVIKHTVVCHMTQCEALGYNIELKTLGVLQVGSSCMGNCEIKKKKMGEAIKCAVESGFGGLSSRPSGMYPPLKV